MKYRVGRKQKRAVLDELGHEVVIFPKGRELFAAKFCEYINNCSPKDLECLKD